jgi:outer membrane protein assembly factor BamB
VWGVKRLPFIIAVVVVIVAYVFVWNTKEPVQPSASNPEATKPEPTKAKATAGVQLWEFKTGYGVFSSPAIGSDGTVYVGSYDKKLYAIKTKSKGLAKSPWPMRGQNPLHTGRVMKK